MSSSGAAPAITGTVATQLPTAVALSDVLANPTTPLVGASLLGWNNTNWQRMLTGGALGPNAQGLVGLLGALPYLYNGTNQDQQRTPNIFKTATATALGDTAVWTPAAGKKFRLMGMTLEISANASLASAGVNTILMRDATTAIGVGFSPFIPGAAGTAFVASGAYTLALGNGYLSSAANNVLNLNLGTALATGVCRVNAWGTEE